MPRPLRIEYDGAWYHVMNRGTNHQKIFYTNEHRALFLRVINEAVKLFSIELHAYCLMENHYHLLIHTPFANLGKTMRHINGIYTQRFNQMEKRDGALFRGRYKAIIVDADSYLLQVTRYIHFNPVEAGIVQTPYEYPWSSYRYYLDWEQSIVDLKTNFILDLLGGPIKFEKHHENGIDDIIKDFYNQPYTSPVLGERQFVSEKTALLDSQKKQSSSSDFKRSQSFPTIQTIVQKTAGYLGTTTETITSKVAPGRNIGRMLSIYLAKYTGQMTYKQIAEYFNGIGVRGIGSSVRRCIILSRKNYDIKKAIDKITSALLDE